MRQVLHPSLEAVVQAAGLEPDGLTVGVSVGASPGGRSPREEVVVCGAEATAVWGVPSLRALFRGSERAPDLGEYPVEFVPVFFAVEMAVVQLARVGSPPRDAEMEEVYSNLRRRPDGRSLGPVHDAMWRACALMLGRFELSQDEFEAVLGRLTRSARTWKRGPSSRGYVEYLLSNFSR